MSEKMKLELKEKMNLELLRLKRMGKKKITKISWDSFISTRLDDTAPMGLTR